MKKLFCAIISVAMILGMTSCAKDEPNISEKPSSFSFTLNGRQTVIFLEASTDDINNNMTDLGFNDYIHDDYGTYGSNDIVYLNLYTAPEGLQKFEFFTGAYSPEESTFSLMGITEKSTVDDINALFGEPFVNHNNWDDDGESTAYMWNFSIDELPCELWVDETSDKLIGSIVINNLSQYPNRETCNENDAFKLTVDGKETEICLYSPTGAIKNNMDDLGLECDFNANDSHDYVSYVEDDFYIFMQTDDKKFCMLNINREKSSTRTFNLLGITEKSTVDDITALFGNYSERLAGDGEYEQFLWENVEVAGKPCEMWIMKYISDETIDDVSLVFTYPVG